MVTRHVVTLANSIVGVSVLAMPFCFKQCGIVLATLSLMMGAVMTRMVCYFLLKAAVMSRRRTYEMLAWSTFGHTGKFMVEISIIGFLIGTLIAFMVVIGDLGPEILSEIFSVENNSSLRTIIMTALSLFVALPLGLLRNIDSLSSVSTASVLFYLFLVLKIFADGIGPLWSGEYLERIHFWKSGGVLQCIPIFSMALSCQTQVFGIYDALPEPSLQKMNDIVKKAVNICTFFYFCVGFFGYIAFSQQNFGGNILLSFSNTWTTQLIKSMFLMSVVFSVPLVVFPCRASLHSLIFRSASAYHHVHDMSTNYIPESRMKFLTVTIVGSCLVVGILIPNIELVLGLVGSTTGSVICIIFPSIMFVRVTSKNTTERLLAQFMFVIGVVLMLLTTYATLYAAEQSQTIEKVSEPLKVTENMMLLKPILHKEDIQLNSPKSVDVGSEDKRSKIHHVEFEHKLPEKMISNKNIDKQILLPRRESSSLKIDVVKKQPVLEVSSKPPSRAPPPLPVEVENVADKAKPLPNLVKIEDIHLELKNQPFDEREKRKEDRKENSPSEPVNLPPPQLHENRIPESVNKVENIQNADVKFESENQEKVNKNANKEDDHEKKDFVEKHVAEEFLKRLEEHQENQKKLLKEQKEILEELKQHHAQDVREKWEKEKENPAAPPPLPAQKEVPRISSFPKASVSIKDPEVVDNDKIILEQEKIIEKISENIEKEKTNVKLLEKLEEGLNKEVQMLDAKNKSPSGPVSPNSDKKAMPINNPESQSDLTVNINNNKVGDPAILSRTNNNFNLIDNNNNINSKSVKHSDPHLNEISLVNSNFNNYVMKNIDKEKGVLVGSLAANKRSDSIVATNVKEDKGDVGVEIASKNKNQNQINNNKNVVIDEGQRGNAGLRPNEKIDVPIPMLNLGRNEINKDFKAELAKDVPSSSTKKSVPDSVSKDKRDREI